MDATTTHESRVRTVHPDATIDHDPDPLAYAAWLVRSNPGSVFVIGSGPTPDEAWRNAAIHQRRAIEAAEKAEGGERP